MATKRRSFLTTCFYDKNGQLVLGQTPNLPQLVGWTGLLASWPLSGQAGHIAGLIALASWTVWALLEIFAGVNYFRRTLGLVVLAVCVGVVIR